MTKSFQTSVNMLCPTLSSGHSLKDTRVNNLLVVMLWMYVVSPISMWNILTGIQNASKNAGDMITKYQILFNRTRQAVITGELVEIITGAAASEE
jgi:hypothetical protein